MQITQTFPTQYEKPSLLPNIKAELQTYVNNLDKKIQSALKSQNTAIDLKKQEMLQQMELIKGRKEMQSLKTRKMEEYFVKYCQAVLKEDIHKWKNSDTFYKQLFKMYDKRIKQTQSQNTGLREKIRRLNAEVKIEMKEVRVRRILSNKKVPHSAISNLVFKESIATEKSSALENSVLAQKTFFKQPRMKTQVSVPTLARVDSFTKKKNIMTTAATTKNLRLFSIQNRFQTQVSKGQKNQHQFREQITKKLTTATKLYTQMSDCSFMNPIRTVKISQESSLGLLQELLDWSKMDYAKKEFEDNWFHKIIFNQRSYKKIKNYLRSNNVQRVRRVVTER